MTLCLAHFCVQWIAKWLLCLLDLIDLNHCFVRWGITDCCLFQVCGRVLLPVSSWLVLWQPCSGSSTILWRCTSACHAPLHLRCPSPWRRSSVLQSNPSCHWAVFSRSNTFKPPNSYSTQQPLYLCPQLLLLFRAQGCYFSCIFKSKTGEKMEPSLLADQGSDIIFLCRNISLVLSVPVLRLFGNSN